MFCGRRECTDLYRFVNLVFSYLQATLSYCLCLALAKCDQRTFSSSLRAGLSLRSISSSSVSSAHSWYRRKHEIVRYVHEISNKSIPNSGSQGVSGASKKSAHKKRFPIFPNMRLRNPSHPKNISHKTCKTPQSQYIPIFHPNHTYTSSHGKSTSSTRVHVK